MNRDFLAYAQFEGFWERFQPLTPFGRAEKERMPVHTEAGELEALWDRTDAALALLEALEADPVRSSRLLHHLKRLPRFPDQPREVYDEVELFQFKKFLHNFHALLDLLDAPTREAFGLRAACPDLAEALDTGRQSAESFYVADGYDPDLAQVRAALREADAEVREARARREREIQERCGFSFGTREFLLVPKGELPVDLLLVEPYDEARVAVRPLRCAPELVLQERRTGLLERERALEAQVLERLSALVRGELPALLACRQAVQAFDLAFARARLAREYRLVRPALGEGPVAVEGGRFIPCEELCGSLDLPYTPMDARFGRPATVVFGSNMGGKTVVLKTLAFLQLCAQTGLYVPARAFATRVFRRFHYIGEGRSREGAEGLSGFGFEIRQLVGAWAGLEEPTLLLLDEFARTTSSHEAEALLSAVVEALAARPAVLSLLSTHFRGVRRFPGVDYRRMRGLERSGLDLHEADRATLPERIRLINRRMDYRMVPDEGGAFPSDALAVATLLGLEAALGDRARAFLES